MRSLIPRLRRPAPPPVEAPVPPPSSGPARRQLPPGAALWRATAPRLGTAEEGPVPVWRSPRPPRAPVPPRAGAAPAVLPADFAAAPALAVPGTPHRAPAAPRSTPAAAETTAGPDPAVATLPPAEEVAPEAPMTAAEPPPRGWRLRRRPVRRRADPAPSRAAYRLHRLWLTPMVRVLVRVGLPAWLLAMAVGLVVSDPDRRAALDRVWTELRDGLEARPEFQVTGLVVEGASPPVAAALVALAPQDWPVSSFRLDLETVRLGFEALDAVARADLRVRPDGVLEVQITERVPAAVWHTGDGLALVDAEGYRVARLLARAGRPDLPLIGGAGADRAVAEALTLIAAAAPLGEILIGLVRMGERRWDVVLEDDRRILLPETGAVAALERVLAQDAAEDLFARDVMLVDMRLPDRPTLRLTGAAIEEVRRVRAPGQSMAGEGAMR